MPKNSLKKAIVRNFLARAAGGKLRGGPGKRREGLGGGGGGMTSKGGG